ncbi:MAG: hypothetical protein ACR2O6_07190 [Ilumatobacteraceae bacterium]
MKAKSDRYAEAILASKPRVEGRYTRMPGARGWRSLMSGAEDVQVLDSHWDPFFVTQAGRHGWSEESLRADWEAQRS